MLRDFRCKRRGLLARLHLRKVQTYIQPTCDPSRRQDPNPFPIDAPIHIPSLLATLYNTCRLCTICGLLLTHLPQKIIRHVMRRQVQARHGARPRQQQRTRTNGENHPLLATA